MAIKKTIEIDVNASKAVKELESINDTLIDQKEILVELEREYLELDRKIAKIPKTQLAALSKMNKERDHLRDSIKDQKLSLRELRVERDKNITTVKSLTGATEDSTYGHEQSGLAILRNSAFMELLDDSTGGLASSTRHVVEQIHGAQGAFGLMGKSAKKALKGVRAGIIATGIGVFLIALGAVVANWDKITKALGGADEAQKGLNASMDAYKEGVKEAVLVTDKVKRAFKQAEDGIISKKKALNIYNTELGDTFGKARNLNEAEDIFTKKTASYIKAMGLRARANKLAEMAAEEHANMLTLGMENQVGFTDIIEDSFSSVENFTNAFFGNAVTRRGTAKRQQDEAVADLEKSSQRKIDIWTKESEKDMAAAIDLEKANGIKILSNNNYTSNAASNVDKLAELKEQQAADAKAQDDLQEALKNEALDRIALAEYEAVTSATQQEIDTVRAKYFELIALAEQYDLDTKVLNAAQEAEVAEIEAAKREADAVIAAELAASIKSLEDEARDEKTKLDEEARLKQLDQMNEFADHAASGINALSALNDLVTDAKLEKAEGNAEEEEKIRKKSWQRQKVMQLGLAVIDGFKAITASLAQSPVAIGPIPNPAGIASLVFAGITSAFNIAKIAASKYKSTAGGGGGSPPSPVIPTVSEPQPANFNVVGDSGTNQLIESLGQQQPIQAYVVGGDVTTQQSLDRNKIETASI